MNDLIAMLPKKLGTELTAALSPDTISEFGAFIAFLGTHMNERNQQKMAKGYAETLLIIGPAAALESVRRWRADHEAELNRKREKETRNQAAAEFRQLAQDAGYDGSAMRDALLELTKGRLAKLEGQKLERLPSLGVRIPTVGNGQRLMAIKPEAMLTASGVALSGKFKVELSKGIKCVITHAGRLRVTSWWKDIERSKQELAAVIATLELLRTEPAKAVENASHCCICSKALTDEASRQRGIGPECWSTFVQPFFKRNATYGNLTIA